MPVPGDVDHDRDNHVSFTCRTGKKITLGTTTIVKYRQLNTDLYSPCSRLKQELRTMYFVVQLNGLVGAR